MDRQAGRGWTCGRTGSRRVDMHAGRLAGRLAVERRVDRQAQRQAGRFTGWQACGSEKLCGIGRWKYYFKQTHTCRFSSRQEDKINF